jgi:hypothetical protein
VPVTSDEGNKVPAHPFVMARAHHHVRWGIPLRGVVHSNPTSFRCCRLAENSVSKVITSILKAHLILIDEIGFGPMGPTGAELFFLLDPLVVCAAVSKISPEVGSER